MNVTIPKKILWHATTSIITTTILLGCIPAKAEAVTVSPVRIELSSKPDNTLTTEFKIYNDGTKTATYYISFQNFEAQDESGHPTFTKEKKDLATWAKAAASVTVTPKTAEVVPIAITVPPDIEPGGYFAGIFASTAPPSETEDDNVLVQSDTGTLLLLQIEGNFVEGADILEFSTKDKQKKFTHIPVDFYFRFQNSGDAWEKPLGDIVIKNIFGKTTKIITANPSGNNVLPKSIRRFESVWLETGGEEIQNKGAQRPTPPSQGFWKKVVYEAKHFALGRYEANLTLTYGKEQTKSEASTAFWIIPWHLLGAVLGGLAILILIIGVVIALLFTLILKKRKKK